jgi:hypothetical protein
MGLGMFPALTDPGGLLFFFCFWILCNGWVKKFLSFDGFYFVLSVLVTDICDVMGLSMH